MSVITIHYVVSWFGVFLKFMRARVRVLACLCARGKFLNLEGLKWLEKFQAHVRLCFWFFCFFWRTTTSVCVPEPARPCLGCRCVLAYLVRLEKSWLSISGGEAEQCVPRLSMEHLRDQIIAVSSASLPAWGSRHIIIRLSPLSDENTKLVSSGSVIKQKNIIMQ